MQGLQPDLVVLVADPGLGAINSVRLAAAPFDPLAPVVVVLNRFDAADPLHRANRSWLGSQFGLRLVTDAAALAELVRAEQTTGPTAN